MDQIEQGDVAQTMRLRTAFMHWASCLGIFILMVVIANYVSVFGGLAFFFYLAAGFYLNKAVLPKLIEWHPMYNTLANVTSEKLKLFLAWPLTYFMLFVKLGVNKIL
jgi:hypothetical protein